jgi:hypothetical protein
MDLVHSDPAVGSSDNCHFAKEVRFWDHTFKHALARYFVTMLPRLFCIVRAIFQLKHIRTNAKHFITLEIYNYEMLNRGQIILKPQA